MSALLEALHSGRHDRVAELLAEEPELDLFEVAALGRSDRLQELLEQAPERANEYGDDGFQPLGLACFYGHADAAAENKDEATRFELCELLLDRGADPNLRQGTGDFRAIDAARQSGDERLERLLLDRGAET